MRNGTSRMPPISTVTSHSSREDKSPLSVNWSNQPKYERATIMAVINSVPTPPMTTNEMSSRFICCYSFSVIRAYSARARQMKVTICARVQLASGLNVVLVVPVVTSSLTAHSTASA